MSAEKISTEKTTLGFFGALCGVMLSQVPELRLGPGYSLWPAASCLTSILVLVVSMTYIRRGMNKTTSGWTLVSVAALITACVLLGWPEISMAFELGKGNIPDQYMQSASLKILVIGYLVIWTVFSYFDSGEPVS